MRSLACARSAILLWVILSFIAVPSCRKKEPVYLLRYRYQPGEVLQYGISLKGEGTVKVTAVTPGQPPEEMVLPVGINGKLLLEATVKSVSAQNVAELILSYKDLNFEINNQGKGRELKIVLNDQRMEFRRGERVLKTDAHGEAGYPLNDIVGGTFTVGVDQRGGITRLEGPAGFNRSFPYLDFSGVLEQVQPDFPEGTVRPGGSWSREVDVTVPGLGLPWDKGESWKMQVLSVFRGFESEKEKKVVLIDLSGQMAQDRQATERPDSFILVKKSVHKLTGEVGFDLQEGKALFSRSSLEQEFDIWVETDKTAKDRGLDVQVNFRAEIDIKLKKE